MGCSGSRQKMRMCSGLSLEDAPAGEGAMLEAPRAAAAPPEEECQREEEQAGGEAGAAAAAETGAPATKALGELSLVEAMEIVQMTRAQLKKDRIKGVPRKNVALKLHTHVGSDARPAALHVTAGVTHQTPEETGEALAGLKAPEGTVAAVMLDVPVRKGDRKAVLNAGKVIGKLFLALDQEGVRERIAASAPGYCGHGKQLVKGDDPFIRVAFFFDRPLGPLDHLTMLGRLSLGITLRKLPADGAAAAAAAAAGGAAGDSDKENAADKEEEEEDAAAPEAAAETPAQKRAAAKAEAAARLEKSLAAPFVPELPRKERLAASVMIDAEMEQALVRHLHKQLVRAGYAPQAVSPDDAEAAPSLTGLLTLLSLLQHVETTLRFETLEELFQSSARLDGAAAAAAGAATLPRETVVQLLVAGFDAGVDEKQRQMYADLVSQASSAFAGPEGTYRLSALSGGARAEASVRGVNPWALLPPVEEVESGIKARQELLARERVMREGDVASALFADADFEAAAADAAAGAPPAPFHLVFPATLGPKDWTNVWTNEGTSPQTVRVRGNVLDLEPEQVFRHFYDPEVRALWDQFLVHCQRVKHFEELDADVFFSVFATPPGLTPREFLELRQVRRPSPGTVVVLARSVNLPEVGTDKSRVRGTTLFSSYVFRPMPGGGGTEVTGVMRQDLGGYIPSFALRQLNTVIAEWMHLFITTSRRANGIL